MLQHILNRETQAYLIKLFDKRCFPKEMLLSDNEIVELLDDETEVYGWVDKTKRNKTIIRGLMFTTPEYNMVDELTEDDPDFATDPTGLYLYSVGVPRCHRGNGYARELVEAAIQQAKLGGYTSLSSHCRMGNGWHEAQARILRAEELRVVPDFWEKDGPVQFQRVTL